MTALGDIEFQRTDGTPGRLSDYSGDVVLVVNVASMCGLTPQYEGLQALYADRADQGFIVLGFPANDFGGQEPGTDEEIAEFCSTNYSVTFPVMSKICVLGEQQHPLYTALTRQIPTVEVKADMRGALKEHGITPTQDPDVLWNFEKFLISKDGDVVARFTPATTPEDKALLDAIDTELAREAPSA
jgi:glutathione peroxidase